MVDLGLGGPADGSGRDPGEGSPWIEGGMVMRCFEDAHPPRKQSSLYPSRGWRYAAPAESTSFSTGIKMEGYLSHGPCQPSSVTS